MLSELLHLLMLFDTHEEYNVLSIYQFCLTELVKNANLTIEGSW